MKIHGLYCVPSWDDTGTLGFNRHKHDVKAAARRRHRSSTKDNRCVAAKQRVYYSLEYEYSDLTYNN
jgi:hypothetical protein